VASKSIIIMNKEIFRDGICYMCSSGCPIKMQVSQGKMTHIVNADPRMKTCPRWRAILDFVYHLERLKYPLELVGERGKGTFMRISWDKALDTIAGTLQRFIQIVTVQNYIKYA
jgi:anaerobic selenocysteine-containing dehydrogenase